MRAQRGKGRRTRPRTRAASTAAKTARGGARWKQSGSGPLYEPAPPVRSARADGDYLVCDLAGHGEVRVAIEDLGVPRRPKIVAARPSADFEGILELVHRDGSVLEVPSDHVLYVLSPTYNPAAEARAREELRRRIAERLRQRRKALGLTTDFVARRAGLSRPNYARMESGRRLHQLDLLERVARVLRASIADFVATEPPRWAPAGGDRAAALHRERRSHAEAL